MGKTSFSGPVYGAKSMLWKVGPAAAATTNASTVNAFAQPGYGRIAVPPGEDWIVTGAYLRCSTCSTVANAAQWKLKVEGGSSNIVRADGQATTNAATILTIATGASTVTPWPATVSSNVEGFASATATAGEYEGTWCPSGSTLRWCSSYADPPTTPEMLVYGFIRFVSSTRAE